jgi:CDP-glucose 4,6-dehydratase
MNNLLTLRKFWRGKKVFLTGHSGFKGSWFAILLNLIGAKVAGYSLRPEIKPNIFDLIKLNHQIDKSILGDIRNYDNLKNNIKKFAPDFIVHMAAQPLVRESYVNPRYTYEVNTLGTINILNILNELNFIKSALIVTTDKVYLNNNKKKFFSENDSLGGADPYSSSKSCAELAVNAYNQSFFNKKSIFVATARAGNVIGGGDFSKDRIIPDYFRSFFKNKKLIIRSPNSIRPWQHVLDPLYGYLLLLMKLHNKQIKKSKTFNFGPSNKNNKTVSDIINLVNEDFNNCVKIIKKKEIYKNYHESKILMLNSNHSKKVLKWKCKYNLKQSVKLTSLWFKKFMKGDSHSILKFTQNQIKDYFN